MERVAELPLGPRPRALLPRLASAYAVRVAAVTAVGLAGRLALLGYQPLWRDEAFTAVVVQRPLGQMLDAVRADSAPPLAYILDHAVAQIWSTPAGLRLLSALAGAAAIPLAAALGRRIAGQRAGVLAALVMAVTPAMVLSARDVRMYALATTLVLASSLLLWRALAKPGSLRFALYAACTALALYTDYFAVLGVAAQILALLALRVRARSLVSAAAAAIIAGLTLVPWLLAARGQLGHSGSAFWVPPIGFASVSGEFVQFLSGPPVDPWVPGKVVVHVFQGFAVAAGVLAAFALWRWRARISPAGRPALRYCLICGLAGLLILLVISIWKPLLDGRYASVVWAILFVLIAAGLVVAGSRRLSAAAVALMAATSIALAAAPTHPATPTAVSLLEQQIGPNDLVAAHPSQYLLFLYYGDAPLLARTRVVSSDVPWFWGTAAYPAGSIIPEVPSQVTATGGVIYYAYEPDEGAIRIPSGYSLRATRCWTGVCVATYRK